MFLGDNQWAHLRRASTGAHWGQPFRTEPNSSDSHDTFKLAGDTSDRPSCDFIETLYNNVPYSQFFCYSSYPLEGGMFNLIQEELGSAFIGFSFMDQLIRLATNSSLFSFVGFTISLW